MDMKSELPSASSRNILLDYDIKYFVELKWLQYMFFVFLFIILEAGVAADVFLNHEWEEVHCIFKHSYLILMRSFMRSK